jgi:hypothetical protein
MPREPLLLAWLPLAHYAPLPSKTISAEVHARPSLLVALGFGIKEAVPPGVLNCTDAE